MKFDFDNYPEPIPNETIDFKKYALVGCIPKIHSPLPPTDQSPCVLEGCPMCSEPMWVSEMEREWRKENDLIKIYCFVCLVRESVRQGIDIDVLPIGD